MSLQSVMKAAGGSFQGARQFFPKVGDQAPDVSLTSTEGTPVTLSSFWSKKPTILLFLRYFGCPFCREQVAMIRQGQAELEAAGAQIVCIGQGPYKAGKAFSILMDISFPVIVCGDDLSAYEKYGLVKGTVKQIINVNVLLRGFAALRHGMGRVEGDTMQMPGVFIVDEAGTVQFAHRNVDQADNVKPDTLLNRLSQLNSAK